MTRAALALVLALLVCACSGDRSTSRVAPSAVLSIASAPTRVQPPPESPLADAEPPRADPRDLARRLRGLTDIPPVAAPSAADEQIGAHHQFWVVQSDPPRAFQVAATLRATSEHAVFYVQDGAGVSDADMAKAARDFEACAYPTVTGMLGDLPPDPSFPDPRITILHLNLPGVGGYFSGSDQLPSAIARLSNQRRMVYIDLRAGKPGTDSYVGVVAHEFQHLVHQTLNPTADSWLTEGLSEVANERASGSASYLRAYQNAPNTQLTDWAVSGANTPHYGAAHSFLRYLIAHYGGFQHARDLAAAGGTGVSAVQKYLRDAGFGATFEDVFADWLVSGYLNQQGEARYANPGAPANVRTITRLSEPDNGRGELHQFGADYFEIDARDGDRLFRFRGSPTVKQAAFTPPRDAAWWSGRCDSLDATLTRELDLRGLTRATLRFKTWFNIERGYDYAYVEASADGGRTWQLLRGGQMTDDDPVGAAYGPGYTGVSGGGSTPTWVDEQVDLTPLAGRVVLLRFEYVTDEAVNADGIALDGITVAEAGYADDAQAFKGWQSAGFRRVTGTLPQRFLIQLVRDDGNSPTVERFAVPADGSVDIPIRAGSGRIAVIVAGATYGTNQPAVYRWDFGPPGR